MDRGTVIEADHLAVLLGFSKGNWPSRLLTGIPAMENSNSAAVVGGFINGVGYQAVVGSNARWTSSNDH